MFVHRLELICQSEGGEKSFRERVNLGVVEGGYTPCQMGVVFVLFVLLLSLITPTEVRQVVWSKCLHVCNCFSALSCDSVVPGFTHWGIPCLRRLV